MKIIKFIAAVLLLAATLPVVAQENSNYQRVSIGYSASFINPKWGNDLTLHGFNANYNYGLSLSESIPVYLEAGAGLIYGSTNSGSRCDILSIMVPVNAAYRFALSDAVSLMPYTGINFKFNVYDENIKPKCFQMGWQIGAGVNLKAWYVGLEYELDFIKMIKKVNTSALSVKFGYNF